MKLGLRLLFLVFLFCLILIIHVIYSEGISPKDKTIGNIMYLDFLLLEFFNTHQKLPATLTELVDSLDPSIRSPELKDGWGGAIYYLKTNDSAILRSYGKDWQPGGSGDAADIERQLRVQL